MCLSKFESECMCDETYGVDGARKKLVRLVACCFTEDLIVMLSENTQYGNREQSPSIYTHLMRLRVLFSLELFDHSMDLERGETQVSRAKQPRLRELAWEGGTYDVAEVERRRTARARRGRPRARFKWEHTHAYELVGWW